jgi:hypothetical protein
VLVTVACGDDSGDGDGTDAVETDSGDTEVTLEATFRGVTEDTINIGVTMLDFPLLGSWA